MDSGKCKIMKDSKMKKFVPAFIAVILFFTGACSAKAQDTVSPALTEAFKNAGLPLLSQKAAPRDFALPLASSTVPETLAKPVSLADFKGKVVFLNFWATWCGPCRAEMPSMEALYDKFKDRGFEILAVNSGERTPDVLSFMKENQLTFPALLDTNGQVSRTYGIQAIPTSFLIDRSGMIIMKLVGSINWDAPQIHTALELLLAD